MATFYGVNNAKGRTSPPTMADNGQAGGRVRAITDTYTVTSATHGNGTILTMGRNQLPKDATVLGVRVGMAGTSAGTGRTLSVGYTGAATAFINAGAVATTGLVLNKSVGAGVAFRMPASAHIICTTGGGAFATGAIINIEVEYTID